MLGYEIPGIGPVIVGGTNTAGVLAPIYNGPIFLAGINLTISQNSNSLTFSAGAGGGGAVSFSAGTSSAPLASLVFSDLNGISFGLNGSTITGSHNALTSQSNQAVSGSNGSFTFQTVSFGNSNNFSFYTTNGSIVGSYTVPAVTNSSWTVSDPASSGSVARLAFTNLNGVTLSLSTGAGGSHTIVGSHNGLTSQSNQALSAPNGSFTFQTAQFHNSFGISWSTTTGSGIVASHNGITSQSNQQMTLFATSNTTQSSSGTTNASSLIFAGAGIASVGITNGSVVVSVPAGGGAGDGGVFAGVSTFGNTAGSTGTVSTGNFVLVGSNGITLSQSTGGVGSAATVTIFGETSPIASSYLNAPYMWNTVTQTLSNSLSYCNPFIVQDDRISFNYARKQWSIGFTSTSFASTANTSYSYNLAHTHNIVIYSKGTGASSLSLISIGSTSVGFTHSIRLSRNTTNNISVTHGFTFPSSAGTESTSFSYAATNSSDQFSTTGLSVMTGIKHWITSYASSLRRGQYYWMDGYSSAQTTQQTAALSNARMRMSHLYMSQANITVAPFATAPNAALYIGFFGPGSFSTAGGATTSILPIVNISSTASHPIPWLALEMLV